jgi:hypothetical protein
MTYYCHEVYPILEIFDAIDITCKFYKCENLAQAKIVARKVTNDNNVMARIDYLSYIFIYRNSEQIYDRNATEKDKYYERQWFWNYPSVEIVYHDN